MSRSLLEFEFKKQIGLSHTEARGRLLFEQGNWVQVVMGPSGAGKTTFARWLAGLADAEEGLLKWNGNFWSQGRARVSPQSRRVGFMAQGDRLFPHLSVAQNVAYGLRTWEKSKRELRLREIMAVTGLSGMESRRPQTLSGGEKRRVALAQVLAVEPVLLILDEPFAGLDLNFRKSFWLTLKSWIETCELPTLVITHDETEARSLTQNIHLYENRTLHIR